MLFKETAAPQTLDLIKRFFKDSRLDEFVLVGGTALSLQIGHRVSLDIDLFNVKPFDAGAIAAYLRSNYGAEHIVILENCVFCFVEDIKVDIISHQYPWVEIPMDVEGVRMVSLADIGAMKLNAIVQNGSRLKDFVDVYFLLECIPLQKLLRCCEMKYRDLSDKVIKRALLYHDDIKPAPIAMTGEYLSYQKLKYD